MKNTRKLVSLILSVSMILSIYGCSLFKKKVVTNGEIISADTPWYNCEVIECSAKLDEDLFVENQCRQQPIGKISDGYVFAFQGFGMSAINLYLYSEKGKLIADMELLSKFNEAFSDINLPELEIYRDIYIQDGSLKLKVNNFSNKAIMVFDIDIMTGGISLSESHEFSRALTSAYGETYIDISRTRCGKYDLYASKYDNFSVLSVGPDGEEFCFSPGPEFVKDLSGYVSDFLPVSDTQVLFFDYQTFNYFIYDAANRTLSKETSDYEWIKPYFTYYREDNTFNVGSDGKIYFITSDAIATPDFDNKCMKNLILFENMDINRAVFVSYKMSSHVFTADEETAELAVWNWCPESAECVFDIYRTTKAKTNPNAGKAVITTDGIYDAMIYDAIYTFNRTDKDYFIKLVPNKYDDKERDSYGTDVPYFYTQGEVGNQMMVDLMAGDCPDVVFYVSGHSQLNNGNCMMDLKPYFENSKVKSDVFGNIVSACESNGGLYAMPLSFVLDGIIVDRTNYDVSGNGMTYEQFGQYTDSYSNGVNQIARTQTGFISECMKCEYDLFETNGVIDFNVPAFKELAEYTAENVNNVELQEYLRSRKKDYAPSVGIEGYLGWFSSVYSVSYNFKDADLVGFPSGDSRGPSAEIRRFVSITQGSKCPEGSWRFIEMLLSQEIQTNLCKPTETLSSQNSFPINRKAFDEVGEICIDTFNHRKEIESSYAFGGGISTVQAEKSDLETIKNITESVTHIVRSDAAIEIIIYEEIQPYLVGDKSIDDVIKIMNDRARTVINERN